MNIIDSDVLTSKYDELWSEPTVKVKNMIPAPVLVITSELNSAEERAQLQKMLDACKITADAVNTISLMPEEQIAWHKLNHLLQPRVVFLFGIMPVQLGISSLFRLCEMNRFDGAIWLPAPGIAALEQQPELKRQLWLSGMKPVFLDGVAGSVLA